MTIVRKIIYNFNDEIYEFMMTESSVENGERGKKYNFILSLKIIFFRKYIQNYS